MVATLVLEASGEIRVGSSPTWGTKKTRFTLLRYNKSVPETIEQGVH